jgi:hypothetical protein
MPRGQREGSLRLYSGVSRPELKQPQFQLYFTPIFSLSSANKGHRIQVRFTFTVRRPYRNKTGRGEYGRKLQSFSIIGLHLSLVTKLADEWVCSALVHFYFNQIGKALLAYFEQRFSSKTALKPDSLAHETY